jgi:hypothetical protein
MLQPPLRELLEMEDERDVTALAVVTANPEHQPWITAFGPEYLGGNVIPVAYPILDDPVVAAAWDTFHGVCSPTGSLTYPTDHDTVKDGLAQLRKAGHTADPGALAAAALAAGWSARTVLALHELASTAVRGRGVRAQHSILSTDQVAHWTRDLTTR